jgi:hypothetical protein
MGGILGRKKKYNERKSKLLTEVLRIVVFSHTVRPIKKVLYGGDMECTRLHWRNENHFHDVLPVCLCDQLHIENIYFLFKSLPFT